MLMASWGTSSKECLGTVCRVGATSGFSTTKRDKPTDMRVTDAKVNRDEDAMSYAGCGPTLQGVACRETARRPALTVSN
jgi:hypothetical protein